MRTVIVAACVFALGCSSPESKSNVSANSAANNSNNANNANNANNETSGTNNTSAQNSNANNTTSTNNQTTRPTNNKTTVPANNTTATPEDCGDNEVFVEDECFECGPVDNCVRSGSACVPACVDNECLRGFCVEGACRNFCG